MTTMNVTGLPKAMQISNAAMDKIVETLSSERNRMLISLAANYAKQQFEKVDTDLYWDACNKPNILFTQQFPKWECNIRGDIMEMKTDLCFEPMREGPLLIEYFGEQLGEDVTHIIEKMEVIPSFKDFSVTFGFKLYPVTITDVNSLLDHAEKLENENKKLLSEVDRLSDENSELREKLDQKPTGLMVTAKMDRKCAMEIYDAMIQKAFSKYEDTYNHRKLSEQVKKIVSNPKKRTTVILWKNGDKTITKAMKGEKFDAEKGIAMAFMKYAYGNNGAYMKEIRKAIAED